MFSMIEQAIEAQFAWQDIGYRVPVSINFPAHLLNDETLPDRLLVHVLHLNGVPTKLCFELTECSMTELQIHYIAGVCRLRLKGFGLARDDFGQGFRSYYHLVNTPFTELKIDRALIANCENEESIGVPQKGIRALAQYWGLEVVAEGGGNVAQLALLCQFDCDAVQGFLISKALPTQALSDLLQQ
ncbi:EAL domain-containing protein [Pseudomonas koreensis]|uniref:EAL domain-containing protein n=1 Tax=Pseudomonas koreensis TaxID=198620 RepID=UPI002FC7F1FC